ncbi:MAG TPA: carboxypeptidase-like regulatory domain-containing protein, partial [Dysgonamonadaceae bacterium]|nr:carboxypeptidase-like regulatory domain-containing protein [Dysgonamonadaceae bacterium]
MKMKRDKKGNALEKSIFTLAFLWLTSLTLLAQNITVKGNVVDEQKEPLIGVSVKIQGTTTGTVTDYDGNFELPNVPPTEKLEFSYVGMKTLVVPVDGRTVINVTMQEDVEMLEEVVITGYGGTQLRSRSTNSIAKVENKKLEAGIFSNPAQALSGAVSGLRVVQYSGNPGATPSIVLRGGTNLDGSGSPLIVVDGQVRGSLSDI